MTLRYKKLDEKSFNSGKEINRDNFNPVAVMVSIDTIDEKEIKRLLEEACYCIAYMRNEINGYLLAEREILESINKVIPTWR